MLIGNNAGGAAYYASSLKTVKGATLGTPSTSSVQENSNTEDVNKFQIWDNLPESLAATRLLNISTEVLYEMPDEPYPRQITKHICKGGTRTWCSFPGGNDIGDSLQEILSPDEYKVAMIAFAEVDGRDSLAKDLAESILGLETELEGAKLTPTPLEERDWYIELKGVGAKWKEEFEDVVPGTGGKETETIIYTPLDDLLKIAVEAKYNFESLLNVVNGLEGLERAQALHHLADGDKQYIRNELGKIADKPVEELSAAIQRSFESKELAKSLGGTFPWQVNPSSNFIPLLPDEIVRLTPISA